MIKKEWKRPELTVLGTVETLTLTKAKALGSSDGFVLATTGQPVMTVSI